MTIKIQGTLSGHVLRDSEGSRGDRMPVMWCFDPADPLAVTLTWPDGAQWALDRALLVNGGGHAGADLRIVRSLNHVLLLLSSPYGDQDIEFARDEVDALLAGAERLVPLDGNEVPEHQVDAFLARALEATP